MVLTDVLFTLKYLTMAVMETHTAPPGTMLALVTRARRFHTLPDILDSLEFLTAPLDLIKADFLTDILDSLEFLTTLTEALIAVLEEVTAVLKDILDSLDSLTALTDSLDSLTALTEALITVLEEILDIPESLEFLTALTEAAMAVLEEVTTVLEAITVATEAPGPHELVEAAQESSTTTGYLMTRPRCPRSTPMREATPGTDGASRPGATSSPNARPCSRFWTGSSDATNIRSPRT